MRRPNLLLDAVATLLSLVCSTLAQRFRSLVDCAGGKSRFSLLLAVLVAQNSSHDVSRLEAYECVSE